MLIISLHINGSLIKQMGKEVVCFWNYNISNQKKNHETGNVSKFLKGITEDDYIKAYNRANYILTLRGGF